MIFFTGCTHFRHANIIRLANRPFSSVEEMDATMIENWNKTVKRRDIVYHLGDFAWKGGGDLQYRLNGEKVWINGNHDPRNWGQSYLEWDRRPSPSFVMFHYPLEEWNGWWRGAIHVHCHTHKTNLASAPRRFNVGVDATGFAPISLDEILAHPNSTIPPTPSAESASAARGEGG